MKTKARVFFVLLLLATVLTIHPLEAKTFSAEDYEQSHEAIRNVVRQKGSSAELDTPLYIAQAIAFDVMDESDFIELIYSPRLSPDQSMVFIGYFLKDEPGKLRIIYLHRPTLDSKLQIKNDTIEGFSKFTYENFKTKFYYVERMDGTSQERAEQE